MKTAILPLAAVLLAAALAHGQPVVVLDSLAGDLVCGELAQFIAPYTQYVAIENPDSVQKELRIVLSLHVDPGHQLQDIQVHYLNGFEAVFGFTGTVAWHAEQQSSTTIVTVAATTNGSGLPGGLPVHDFPVTYLGLSFALGPGEIFEGTESVTVDSAVSPAYGGWYFSSGTASGFAGPLNWPVFETLPNCGSTIVNPPQMPLSASPCYPVAYDFDVADCFEFPAYLALADAPEGAAIDSISGLFTWQPGVQHVGQQFSVRVIVWEDLCAGTGMDPYYRGPTDEAVFTIVVEDCNPPRFVSGQPNTFVTTSGDDLYISMAVTDPDPLNHYTFDWYVSVQDPVPPCALDPATGVFHYLGTPADTNVYWICLTVSEGIFADTTGF
ncbi:MAG TPA: hypothetical protein PKY95_08950, partial [candidate division Zixibacteria bacterium]|nr:hypothetical protein [candidate division Zixibacteria bacterium]